MNSFFPSEKMQGRLGFGYMRLPMKENEIDLQETRAMVDAFFESGHNYFDVAHGYLNGRCESAFRACIAERYPREKYILTNKLTTNFFQKKEDIRPLFEAQLEACGGPYFDFYLMHSQNAGIYAKYKRHGAYEIAEVLKNEGKIRHVGISFHDTAEVLERILREQPQIELVQLQLNYMDWEDAAVQSRLCYEVCVRHHKPVVVMEPVKGGCLARLPEDAQAPLEALGTASPASYAIRFAASLPNVMMVLSGMSSMAQMRENIGFMRNFKPLSLEERAALESVTRILRSKGTIPCTGCRYCVDDCPQGIRIPDLFACLNAHTLYGDSLSAYYYEDVHAVHGGKPSDCLSCGRCMALCPQHLPIPTLLKQVAEVFG